MWARTWNFRSHDIACNNVVATCFLDNIMLVYYNFLFMKYFPNISPKIHGKIFFEILKSPFSNNLKENLF